MVFKIVNIEVFNALDLRKGFFSLPSLAREGLGDIDSLEGLSLDDKSAIVMLEAVKDLIC